MITLSCRVCNAEFRRFPSGVTKLTKYCSRPCQVEGQKKRAIFSCKGCGKDYETRAWAVRHLKFHSKECWLLSKFGNAYIVDEVTGCWNWQRRLTEKGYASGKRPGIKTQRAHRAIWIERNGPVPGGMELDHTCKNRRCVNPDHLEPVTHKINMIRSSSVEASRSATHCRNGHEWTSGNTRVLLRGGRECRECSRASSAKAKAKIKLRRAIDPHKSLPF